MKPLIYNKVYGRLTITSEPFRKYASEKSTQKSTYVTAICECGNVDDFVVRDLKNGTTSSCGCLRQELSGERNKTHGCASIINKDYIYKVWIGIKKRCYSEKEPAYKNYGAKGVVMCDEWLNDFTKFKDWALLNGWKKGLHIDKDKIPNKLGIPAVIYSPEMCSIITHKENLSITSRCIIEEYNGKKQNIRQWSFEYNIKYSILYSRLKSGWDIKKALETPLPKNKVA